MRKRAVQAWLCRSALGLLAASICLVGPPASAAEKAAQQEPGTTPRYQFELGQELVYELTRQEDFREESDSDATANDAARDKMQWRVFVAGKNGDGAWRLYIRTKIAFVRPDGSVRAKRESFGYCDLHPDGTYTLDESSAVLKRLIPDELFCRLPATQAQLEAGWSFTSPVTRYRYDFHLEDSIGPVLQLVADQHNSYEEMHQWRTTKQYAFDVERGRVTRVTDLRFRGGQLSERRTFELVSVEQHEAAWLATFGREAQAYVDAHAKWAGLTSQAYRTNTLEECRRVRDQAQAALAAPRPRTTLSLFDELYDEALAAHAEEEHWTTDAVKQREQFFAAVPEFPTDWEARHVGGGDTFHLADHRGQVVVLDFWGTNCEYCVLLAPLVKQVVAKYADQGVVFLGMFDRREGDDREDAQAASLIKNVYSELQNVEGNAIAEHYCLHELNFGYPVLVVLDQSGIAREIHHGYSSDAPQRLGAILDDLLRTPSER